jgi:uncharacterized membrane protein
MVMTVLLFFCFLIGCVAGLRSMTAPTVVCWAAHLGWLHFAGTSLGFIDHKATLAIFTLLALGELVVDKLPQTPARTAAPGLIARIISGGFSGGALAVGAGSGFIPGALVGVFGAVVATYAGYHMRHALVTQVHLPDYAMAILEDLMTIAGGFYVVSRF